MFHLGTFAAIFGRLALILFVVSCFWLVRQMDRIDPANDRAHADRRRLVREGGGNSATERAVESGLKWLTKRQDEKGRWIFDQGCCGDQHSATGLALMPFLAAGYGPTESPDNPYWQTVKSGIDYLLAGQTEEGDWHFSLLPEDRPRMYTQSIVLLALTDAYGLTLDPKVMSACLKSIDFIVKAQCPSGGWGYTPGEDSSCDITIVGWQVAALTNARRVGLPVTRETLERAQDFLKGISTQSESRYGYRTKGDVSETRTAVGLLCRQMLGWGHYNPFLHKGVEYLKGFLPDEHRYDLYYYYHATQVMHRLGGPVWTELWNPRMRNHLLTRQVSAGEDAGSWPADEEIFGQSTGRLGATCLAILTLEVYYRHSPSVPLLDRRRAEGQ